MTKIIFAMYNPATDCVEVSLDAEIHISFNCQECNASVHLNEPSDITLPYTPFDRLIERMV